MLHQRKYFKSKEMRPEAHHAPDLMLAGWRHRVFVKGGKRQCDRGRAAARAIVTSLPKCAASAAAHARLSRSETRFFFSLRGNSKCIGLTLLQAAWG